MTKVLEKQTLGSLLLGLVEDDGMGRAATTLEALSQFKITPIASFRLGSIIKQPPLVDKRFFHTVNALLREPGDFIVAKRTDEGTIRVAAGNQPEEEKGPAETFNDFTADIRSAETFTRVWRQFTRHLLDHVEGIRVPLNMVAASGTTDPEKNEFVPGPETAKLTDPLLPAFATTQGFFNFIRGFEQNEHLRGSWEFDLCRSQKHLLGNSFVLGINFNAFYGNESHSWLIPETIGELRTFFDPIHYIRGLNSHEVFRERFSLSFPGKSAEGTEPVNGVGLVSAIDEIFLATGRTVVDSPHEVEVRRDADTLSIISAGDAFRIYERSSAARTALIETYGADNVEFVPNATDGAIAQIDLAVTNFVPFAAPLMPVF